MTGRPGGLPHGARAFLLARRETARAAPPEKHEVNRRVVAFCRHAAPTELGGDWGAGATDRSLLTELGEGRMVVVSEPRPCLILGISAARRHPRPKAPEAWRSPGRWRVGRGRWKVAKRLGVRQSPAAFPRQGVEKGVGGRDAQDNGTTGLSDYPTIGLVKGERGRPRQLIPTCSLFLPCQQPVGEPDWLHQQRCVAHDDDQGLRFPQPADGHFVPALRVRFVLWEAPAGRNVCSTRASSPLVFWFFGGAALSPHRRSAGIPARPCPDHLHLGVLRPGVAFRPVGPTCL